MDFERLWTVAEQARSAKRLPADDVAFVRDVIPRELIDFPNLELPKRIRHPAGFNVSGRPVWTFLQSALLIAGQKSLGRRFADAPFYEAVEKELALGVMRSHFHLDYPKGTHCCAQCTLAVLPVLEAGAIRFFDGASLAGAVKQIIAKGAWRFSTPPNAKMLHWALGAAPM